MPTDANGKYHLNNQKMRHAEKSAAPKGDPMSMGEETTADEGKDVPHATMVDHGDGTGHTEMADGTRHEHPDMETVKGKLEDMLKDCSGDGGDWG